ncbi:MAG: hypothetical protein OJF49_001517 [Ktedonobacterales bacterium]|jgi:hypothetical protein|nr:MAG: hypothetical protein OJF49_001517 [Ktedonobacterales bacterium]
MARDTITNSSDNHDVWEDDERNDLDDLIAEITAKNPEFPAMVEAALQRRQAARARGEDPNQFAQPDEEEQEQPAAPSAMRA